MNAVKDVQAIILGDPFNNTLGLIRSIGEAGIKIILILVGDNDRIFLCKSKYLRSGKVYRISKVDDSKEILKEIQNSVYKQYLIATNDIAAKYIDVNEEWLSKIYYTPMRGKHIGDYFNKDKQCDLAESSGFDVPRSFIYNRGDDLNRFDFYPVLLKPILSIEGEKSDIHICYNSKDLRQALSQHSVCNKFIAQEYIEKEFEINILGVSTESGVLCPGGIKKIRHYPTIYSPCSFGEYVSVEKLKVNVAPIKKFIETIGYKGLFSVELLRKGDKSYFMEFNFRNDGLAYTATVAGVNMPRIYMLSENNFSNIKFRETYMMDISADFCHVKNHNISLLSWMKDFLKTKCQLNLNINDFYPAYYYYKNKLFAKIKR